MNSTWLLGGVLVKINARPALTKDGVYVLAELGNVSDGFIKGKNQSGCLLISLMYEISRLIDFFQIKKMTERAVIYFCSSIIIQAQKNNS